MHLSFDCLRIGLLETHQKLTGANPDFHKWALIELEYMAVRLIEGDRREKEDARKCLQKLIGRGRCILNAADLAARRCQMLAANGGFEDADEWYAALMTLASSLRVSQLVRDRVAWVETWQTQTPETAFFNEYPEYREE